MFDMVVEDHFDLPDRGLIVIARLLRGEPPSEGIVMVIRAEGRPPIMAPAYRLHSDVWHAHQRGTLDESQDILLFRHLSKQDVPIGAHVTSDSGEPSSEASPATNRN